MPARTEDTALKPRNSKKNQVLAKEHHGHPDHSVHIRRLNRVKGQLNGIERMIYDKRYCPEIIDQLKAARAGLLALESEIFKTHLRSCVQKAFATENAFESEKKIEEIMKMIF